MNPSSKRLYEAPSTECVEMIISNAILEGSETSTSAYRSGYGEAEELTW